VTADLTPTRTSSDPDPDDRDGLGGQQDGPSRSVLFASAVAIAIALVWFAGVFLVFREGSFVDGAWVYAYDDAWGFDIEAYVHAAQRLTTEGSLYARALVSATFEPGGADLYYYAPPLGVAMLPIADVPVSDSSVAWYVLRVALLLAACLLMPVKPMIRALAFLTVSLTLWSLKDAILGNVSILLVFPLVLGWRWMDRPLGSVGLALAMSVRPGLGVFLVWQTLRRRWRALAWTLGAGLVLILATLPFVGVDGYRDYLAIVANLRPPTGPSENVDLGSIVMRLGGDANAISIARAMSVAAGIGIIVLGLRRDREVGYMLTICASLLVVPLLWGLHLLTLVVPLALLAERFRPIVLLLLLASWLPEVAAVVMLMVTIVLLFLAPQVGASARRADHDVAGMPAAA
jgi:hypothetical protein